jgi:hypothetical protein
MDPWDPRFAEWARQERARAEARVFAAYPELGSWLIGKMSLHALLALIRNAERRGTSR